MNCNPSHPDTFEVKRSQAGSNAQEILFARARASLQRELSWHSDHPTHLQVELQAELNQLASALDKLDQALVRIAVFGLVSRGKSAVLNSLFGQKVFPTGPLNGVTQWPRSVRWSPTLASDANLPASHSQGKVQIELIDTPGLEEVKDQVRAQMARDVANQADLILFVVAGDLTRTEYQALCDLREAQKPLLLVFNKADLYPEQDRQTVYQALRSQRLQQLVSADEVVVVAAEPVPFQVRVEWPNGRVTYEWESPPAQVDQLKQRLLQVLNQEGRTLLALNALFQAREAKLEVSRKLLELRETQAQDLIRQFVQYKAGAIFLNPFFPLDLFGGVVADLMLIRSLAKLYGLPITGYQAGKLCKIILWCSGSLVVTELLSGLFFSGSTVAIAEGTGQIPIQVGIATIQAVVAGYGTYRLSRATQLYLANGATWGALGLSTVIQNMLQSLRPGTILYRIQQELQNRLKAPQNIRQ